MKKWIAIMALPTLAACGASDDNEIVSGTVTDEDGNKTEYSVSGDDDKGSFSIKTSDGSLNISSDKDASPELPFGLKLYPGSEVQANVQMKQNEKGTNGVMVTFETTSPPGKVVEHYKSQAKSAGFEIGAEIKSGETMMFNATRDEKDNINVSASARGEGKTTGNILAGTKR